MKYKHALIKDGDPLIKIVLDDNKEVWAETTKAVVNFATENFKDGEVCDFDYEENDEGFFVNKILKKKGSSSGNKSYKKRGRPRKSSSAKTDEKFCECGTKIKNTKYDKCYECNQADKENKEQDDKKYCECGVEIKNTKYDKCYTCNQKNKTSGTSTNGRPDYGKGAPYGDVTDREAERRNKLAVLGSVAQAVATVMVGHIDEPGVLADMILEVHKKVYTELFG